MAARVSSDVARCSAADVFSSSVREVTFAKHRPHHCVGVSDIAGTLAPTEGGPMTRSIRRLAVGVLAALALSATACEPTAVKYGKLDLKLTDAPGDVVTAMVTIDQIYLLPGDDVDGEKIILRDEDVTVDLLTLSDATMDLIVGAEIPVGSYNQLRFVISGGYIEVEGAGANAIYASSVDYDGLREGATVPGSLPMPSFASSG